MKSRDVMARWPDGPAALPDYKRWGRSLARAAPQRAVLILALLLLLAGCSLSPSAEFMDALGRDNATASISIQTIYGNIMWCRTNILAGNVQCSRDGISVKSESATVGVPLTITPQLSIGAPVLVPPAPVQVAPPAAQPRSQVPRYLAPQEPSSTDLARNLLRDHGR